jgi:hypothetical protein
MKRLFTRRGALVLGGFLALVAAAAVVHGAGRLPGNGAAEVTSLDFSCIDRVPERTWERLAQTRIYFGHHSVGSNLLAGVSDIRRAKPQVRLDVVEETDLARLERPVLAHSAVGANRDPESKIRDFVARIESAGPRGVDIALLKFCYVDVTAATRVDELFETYRDAMAGLAKKFPATMFVHVTVPLTTPEAGLKAGVKRLLGKRPWGYDDNLARARYNAKLRAEYRGKGPFLDLAAAESTLPDGTTVAVNAGGETVPYLPSCYTSDGGHLNEVGRVAVARSLICTLAEAVQSQ